MDERIVDQPMVKRVYVSPTIIRVRLNPEQAVLSTCSVGATTLSNMDNVMCRGATAFCRQFDDSGDLLPTS